VNSLNPKLSIEVLYDHNLFLTILTFDPRFDDQGVAFGPENISTQFLVTNRPNAPNLIKISPARGFLWPGGHVLYFFPSSNVIFLLPFSTSDQNEDEEAVSDLEKAFEKFDLEKSLDAYQ
jgi:hypothetical protein